MRTPIGKFGGAFADISAAELGGTVATEAIRRSRIPAGELDSVIFGHGRQAGGGPNTARQIGRRAGLPDESTAYTVNQACASGLRAIINAAQEILLDDAEAIENDASLSPAERASARRVLLQRVR